MKRLLADPRLGRSHPDPEAAARYSESVIFGRAQPVSPTEAAEHTRMRRLLAPWFSARWMEPLRPRVQVLVDGLLDEVAARGAPVDFHEVVSFPLPALVICEILGVPYADREDFRRWSDAAADMTDQQRSFAGLGALWQYMTGLVAAKLDAPGGDVLCALIEARRSDPDGVDEVARLGAALLLAGHETTVAAIDTAVVLLATHPAQRDALRADPARVPGAVEDILRSSLPGTAPASDGCSRGLARWATADLDVDGVAIPAGDLVLVGDRPGFDVTRDPNPHLSFGYGPRFCLGAPLAHLELQVLIASLPRRFPGARDGGAGRAPHPAYRAAHRGVAALPVTW